MRSRECGRQWSPRTPPWLRPIVTQWVQPAFAVFSDASETRHPVETAFDRPTARHQHKARFGIAQLDGLKGDAMPLEHLRQPVTGVALIYEGYTAFRFGTLLDHLC